MVRFDVVMGNPPYIRAEIADKVQRTYLINSDRYQTTSGRFDIFLPFIELNLQLLQEGGHLGMIVPASVLTTNYAKKLRKLILKTFTLLSMLDLHNVRVFEEAAVLTCVPIIRKKAPNPTTQTHIVSGRKNGKLISKNEVSQKIFLKLPGSAIRPDINSNVMQLKKSIDIVSIPMGQLCYCITGLVGHNSKTGTSIDRLIHTTPIDATCKPYIEAKEWEGRYSYLNPQRYIEYKPQVMHRPKFQELFESPKLLIQRLTSGDFIQATVDSNKIYVNHVLNCCTKLEDVIHLGPRLNIDLTSLQPNPNYDLRFILAVVCSRVIGFYHNTYLSSGLDIFPETIRQLPIRRIEFTTPAEERSQLFNNGKQLYKQSLLQRNYNSILEFVEHQLKQISEHADIIHDLVAFLAKEMITMSKIKQEEITGFLRWLEEHIGEKVDNLNNKTKIKAYHNFDDIDKFLKLLHQNRNKFGVNLNTPIIQESIEARFTTSTAKLKPIKIRIAATDRLIDRIIYKLYRLTGEEIRMVEGQEN